MRSTDDFAAASAHEVAQLVESNGLEVDEGEKRLMRIAWLAGYGAGALRVKELAEDVFADIERRVS